MNARHCYLRLFVITVFFAYLCAVVGSMTAAESTVRRHYESRQPINHSAVSLLGKSGSEVQHVVVIALTHSSSIDELEALLVERSTPGSKRYQQWLSFEELSALTTNDKAVEAVTSWLRSNSVEVVWVSPKKDYIKARAAIGRWESLLDTEFHEYVEDLSHPIHKRNKAIFEEEQGGGYTGINHIRGRGVEVQGAGTEDGELSEQRMRTSLRHHHIAEGYSLPESLAEHVEALFNVCHLPPVISRHGMRLSRDERNRPVAPIPEGNAHGAQDRLLRSIESNEVVREREAQRKESKNDVNVQALYVNMNYLFNHYDIPSTIVSGIANASQAVFQTIDEQFSQEDLEAFQTRNHVLKKDAMDPKNKAVSWCVGTISCFEGNLDLQYLMGVAQGAETTYWHVDYDENDVTSLNPFLAWILEVADSRDPPLVHSISWGSIEQDTATSVKKQFNTEAVKLALRGVTIVVSTGDGGVANSWCSCGSSLSAATFYNCACKADSGSSVTNDWPGSNSWSGAGYFPSFPSTSPYVIAVGATMGSDGSPPAHGEVEVACQSNGGGFITTSGGFSTYFSRPSWQSEAVPAYFKKLSSAPANGYNPMGRAIPDVSFVGVAYEAIVARATKYLYGTSASAPVFAGMITLVNALRSSKGLSSVGFINPTLYSSGAQLLYNDITSGSNKCCMYPYHTTCCSAGFASVRGWDPVTGWGSMNFSSLVSLFGVDYVSDVNAGASTTSAPSPSPTVSNGGSNGNSHKSSSSGSSFSELLHRLFGRYSYFVFASIVVGACCFSIGCCRFCYKLRARRAQSEVAGVTGVTVGNNGAAYIVPNYPATEAVVVNSGPVLVTAIPVISPNPSSSGYRSIRSVGFINSQEDGSNNDNNNGYTDTRMVLPNLVELGACNGGRQRRVSASCAAVASRDEISNDSIVVASAPPLPTMAQL